MTPPAESAAFVGSSVQKILTAMARVNREFWIAGAWVLMVALTDVVWRSNTIDHFGSSFWGFYLWSGFYLGITIWLFRQWLGFLWRWRSWAAASVAAIAALVHGFVMVASYIYFTYFGSLPGLFAFEFLYQEGTEGGNIIGYSTDAFAIAAIFVVAALSSLALLWPKVERMAPRRSHIVLTTVWVLSTLVLHNNVRLHPGAFMPEVQALFSFSRATQDEVRGHARPIRALTGAVRAPLHIQRDKLDINILLILHESLRAKSTGVWGNSRDTTPNLAALLQEDPDHAIRFERAYSNATRTVLSFAGFLSGVTPVQPARYLHTVPLLYDYGKVYGNTSTFLISAHRLEWGNIIHYLKGEPIDMLWHKSTGDVEPLSDLGVDDRYVFDRFETFLDGLPAEQRFVGLLHTRASHIPPHSPPEFQKFGMESPLDEYENAILYVDHNERRALEALKQRGLLDRTVIIATADHGEAFGEHDYSGHSHTFYDEEARVPFWIYLPPALRDRDARWKALQQNAEHPVCLADVLPTVLDLIDLWEEPTLVDLHRRFTGRPLTREHDAPRIIFMQNHNDINNRYQYASVGLVDGDYKYLLRVEQYGVLEELYNLASDPEEKNNLWESASQAQRQRIYSALHAHENARVTLSKYRPEYQAVLGLPGPGPAH